MNPKENLATQIILRISSVALMIFSVIFGGTHKLTGYCLGDNILTSLGFRTWSGGTEGLHYTAVLTFVMLFAGFALFASTTQNKLKTFRYFMIGLTVVFIAANLFN